MSFEDIFKKSFLEGYSTIEINTATILVALFFSLILGLYIFFCYRVMTRRTFYSRNFNISLVALTLITSAIILTIQSSVVVSLGMVGALSIVRFRTAIKDPMDLVFLFWAISVGIICGAGLSEIAILSSLAVTLILYILNLVPVGKAPMILVISAAYSEDTDRKIARIVKACFPHYQEKTRTLTDGQLDLVIELRTEEGAKLTADLAALEGVSSVSLLTHDGEVTF